MVYCNTAYAQSKPKPNWMTVLLFATTHSLISAACDPPSIVSSENDTSDTDTAVVQDSQQDGICDSDCHWSEMGTVTNTLVVLGYHFHTTTVENGYAESSDLCMLYATVEFTSPDDEHVRFQTQVTMSNGAWIKSPIFHNDTAGDREFVFSYDTSADDCWGAQRHYPHNLNVLGCRGIDCEPGSDQ